MLRSANGNYYHESCAEMLDEGVELTTVGPNEEVPSGVVCELCEEEFKVDEPDDDWDDEIDEAIDVPEEP